MTVRVICSCGRALRVADRYIGRRVRCPLCSDVVNVDAERGERIYACPDGHHFKAPADSDGLCVACPTCRQRVRLPRSRSAVSVPATGAIHTVAKPVFPDAGVLARGNIPERLWPIAFLVCGAVLLLVSVAWYVRVAELG